MKDQSRGYVAGVCEWNYDMSTGPAGAKCLLLNAGGVAVISTFPAKNEHNFFKAWAPLPKRDKAKEEALGVRI